LELNKKWESVWYSEKNYCKNINEDIKIRNLILYELKKGKISKIMIERPAKKVIINIHTSKPSTIIGKKEEYIMEIKKKISALTNKEIVINIKETKRPELESILIAKNISEQLEKRISFRKGIKKHITGAIKMGAKGIKVIISGRLGGIDIARKETYKEGSIPLNTIRALISYSSYVANTTYGKVGIKIWIHKGEKK
jgi:small subunit ribosomal protein S3